MTEATQKVENVENKGILNKYALVIADVNGLGTKAFSYSIPDDLRDKIKYGSPVVVPFGAKNAVNGFVVGFSGTLNGDFKVKTILDVLDEEVAFSPEYMQLLLWTAKYYVCDLNSVIQVACVSKLFGKFKTKITKIEEIPTEKLNENERKILANLDFNVPTSDITLKRSVKISKEKFSRSIRKLKTLGLIKSENILDEPNAKEKTIKFVKILSKITENRTFLKFLEKFEPKEEFLLSEFLKMAHTTLPTLKKAEQDGLVEIFEKNIYRNPLNIYANEKMTDFPELSAEQKKAYEIIAEKIDEKQTVPILVHGVTASGKTELYFALMKKVIDEGKNVLFLAPEIAIASMLTKKTALRFGIENVAIWHSSISDNEKFDIRQRMKQNKVKILVGARSAVFAPLKNIGLIVIDEEHESSYKQTAPPPYYNACEVAEKLAEINGATIVKGSATPDVCTYYEAVKSDNLIELKERFNNVPLAPVSIVDMKSEYSSKGQRLFSKYLIGKIEENLENGMQTILLMNRLGFSTKIQCPSCGEIITCPHCSVPLVFHKKSNTLRCHWCDYQTEITETCPSCGSTDFKFSGTGTERVEEIAQKLFPSARIARFDSNNMNRKNAYAEMLNEFEVGNIDILIGTSMSAKGLDNENVTLVGVINSDGSFVFPDFRSSERGFQLLTQVAGRAGRGKYGGSVVFQTFNPDFSVISSAKEQNYQKFYDEEIKMRREFGYPPYSQVIRLIVSGEDEKRVFQATEEICHQLQKTAQKYDLSEKISVGTASPCAYEKVNNEYRFEILVKNFAEKKGHALLSKFYKTVKLPNDLRLKIDVSPIDLL